MNRRRFLAFVAAAALPWGRSPRRDRRPTPVDKFANFGRWHGKGVG